jgi:hypothetical protein
MARDMDKKREADMLRQRAIRRLASGNDGYKELTQIHHRTLRELENARRELLAFQHKAKTEAALAQEIVDAPMQKWLEEGGAPKGGPGVPTLLLSDWHWAERVRATEVGGVNSFDLPIARASAVRTFNGAIDLALHHMVRPEYPGIVVPLGGDFIDYLLGVQHTSEEPNELLVRDSIRDLAGYMVAGISKLADAFGHVFIPAVPGNHGRLTKRMPTKNTAATNLDTLFYDKLEDRLAHDKRISFAISRGSDIRYKVYNHRYLLTHGYNFRGGDGIIGAIGPIIRGDKKYRARNSQINRDYDTLLIGHFHQFMPLPGIIVNGSLKGYDEFAYQNGFQYQSPMQAFWFTHPERGITCYWPIQCRAKVKAPAGPWVAVDALYKEV